MLCACLTLPNATQRNFFLLLALGGGREGGREEGVEVETTPFALYYREINFYKRENIIHSNLCLNSVAKEANI